MRTRVFVSTVIDGFHEYRKAAKNGILAAGGESVLIEDYPSLAVSPRSVCLDGVRSSDIHIIVVGSRGGWTAPSGKLVVEEEYEEARRCRLRVLDFVQKVKRDEEAQRFVEKLSDYVDGVFRPTFTTPTELQAAVEKALMPIIQFHKKPEVDLSMIEKKLKNPYKIYNETSLCFTLAPERVDELVDQVSLESPELKRQLLEIGHSPQVELFSYERPKTTEVGIDEIVILQSDEGRHRDGVDEIRLELTTGGLIVIDANVTDRKAIGQRHELLSSMTISEDDIASMLKKCFAFMMAFFEARDPFKRYDRMLYNASLSGIGYRTLISEPIQSGSYSMGSHGDEIEIAFDRPRLITRAELAMSEVEVSATLTLFRRRLKTR